MRRIALVLTTALLLAGCIVPELTLEERAEAVAIRARYDAAIQAGKDAKASADAFKETVKEMAAKVEVAATEMRLLYVSIREGGVDVSAVLAELKKLAALKDELQTIADKAAAQAVTMEAKAREAAAEAVGATLDAKALEKRVQERAEAAGEKTNRLLTWLAVILGVVTGGAGLKVGGKVASVVAAYRRVKVGYSVLAKAIGTEEDGRAPAATRKRINEELAGVSLSDDEMEALRKDAQ